MKVLDLQCPHGHRFEGWFASAEDFEAQAAKPTAKKAKPASAIPALRMTADAGKP